MTDSKTIDEGGFAFPTPTLFSPNGTFLGGGSDGMTLRDWFAGQALACVPLRSWDHVGTTDQERIEAWAKCAYLAADAMIAARKGGAA
jgi:hypothetical protein